MNNFKYNPIKMTPFKWFVLENFPFIEEDFDSLTSYGLWCKLKEYFDKVATKTNEMGTQVESLTDAFTQLKNYIDNYFDNLDVQDEINNKLDEMAESGELEEIIGRYTHQLKEELNNTYLIEEIDHFTEYVSNSKAKYQITKIPLKDNKNNVINLKHGISKDNWNNPIALENALEFSSRKNATACINASVFNHNNTINNIENDSYLGLLIHNSQIMFDNRHLLPNDFLSKRFILGVDNKRKLHSYVGTTPANSLLNDNIVDCFQSFFPLMINGIEQTQITSDWAAPRWIETEDTSPIYEKIYWTLENNKYISHFHLTNFENKIYYEQSNNPFTSRQAIGQNTQTGDIFIISVEGTGVTENLGATPEMLNAIFKYYNCDFAFLLDGGGSTQHLYKNIPYIHALDEKTYLSEVTNGLGTEYRNVVDFIYFSKEPTTNNDNNIDYILEKIGYLTHEVENLRLQLDGKLVKSPTYVRTTNQNTHLGFNFSRYNPNTKEFDEKLVELFDNANNPLGYNLYDLVNQKTLFRITQNDGIDYNANRLLLFNHIPSFLPNETTDLNNIPDGNYRIATNSNLQNQPFSTNNPTDATYYILLQIHFDANSLIQIAIPSGSGKKIWKFRSKSSGNWFDWYELGCTSGTRQQAPTPSYAGQLYLNTDNKKLMVSYAGEWYYTDGTKA